MPEWTVRELLPDAPMEPLSPDRGGYTLTMRECAGAEESLARLEAEAEAAEPGNRLHLGWGSFRNLDLIAARRSSWGLLLDVNRHQFEVWDAVRRALRRSADAAGFIDAVVSELPRQPRLRQFSDSTRTWLRGDLERPGSWLFEARPDRFRHVRRLFDEDRIATACVDLRGGSAGRPFEALAAAVRRARESGAVEPDTVYVSNIPWVLAQPAGFFGEAHAPFLPRDAGSVVAQVHDNLRRLVPAFRWVVCAIRPREDAVVPEHAPVQAPPGPAVSDGAAQMPDDLHWITETLAPDTFLSEATWGCLGR